MTGMILRVVIIVAILLAILWGVRKIWRDWRGEYRAIDEARRARDLRERQRPDVITLERDKDGTYRPPDSDTRH
jgi:hypothetical protein